LKMASRDVVHPLAYELASRRASQPWVSSGTSGLIAGVAVWCILEWSANFTRLEAVLLAVMAFFVVRTIVSVPEEKFWAVYQQEFDKIHFGGDRESD
jgi:hypothetical protein